MSSTLNPNEVRSQFKGTVIFPNDPEYDKAREIFYGGIDSKPAIIIQVANEVDVQNVIELVKKTALPLAIRSGGHSFAAHSTVEGGVVLDLRNLKKVDIDLANETVWAGAGLTARELGLETDKHDLVIGFGDTGSVGISGITLGGGIGFLVRKFGMSIDNLLAAKIVTAEGQFLTIDNDNFPDLFWAIKGGGGNFGVVTELKFKLHRLPQTVGGMMILPATAENITNFMSQMEQAPNELSGILNVMPCPPMPFIPAEHHGQMVLMALVTYAGDKEQGEKVLSPFRNLSKPLADLIKPQHYIEMFPPEEGSYHPTAVSQTMFMKHVDLELAQTMMTQLTASDASMRVVQLRVLGGAMAQIAKEATAFAHRQSKILVNVAAFYSTPEEKLTRQQWVNNLSTKLNQGDNGVYMNFLGLNDVDRLSDAYPDKTLIKLKEIKRRYDPQNIFKLNHNISP